MYVGEQSAECRITPYGSEKNSGLGSWRALGVIHLSFRVRNEELCAVVYLSMVMIIVASIPEIVHAIYFSLVFAVILAW